MSNIIWTTKMSWIASGIVLAGLFMYSLYSGIVYVFFKSKYKGIRFTTKNITYITMLSAAAVTITVVISRIIPITVLPPIRISFEGLMIKITGFIFGPIVGVISGVITDFLCMLFIPSYFHVAYIIVMASYGFVSGMTCVFNNKVKRNKWILFLMSNIFIISFIALMMFFTIDFPTDKINIYKNVYVSKKIMIVILAISALISLMFQLIIFIVYLVFKAKNKFTFLNTSKKFDYATKQKKPFLNENIIAILFLSMITEYYVSSLITPWGDISLVTTSSGSSTDNGYGALLLYRITEAPIKILLNTAIIYTTWRAISPLIKKN